jgi:predicted small secreted protein
MTRLRVRQIGNVKRRHRGKYALHVLEEEQAYQLALVCLILRRFEQRRANARRALLLLLLSLAAAATVENIGRDIQYLTRPIERKYLTFANAHPDSFTAFFRFPQPLMLRLMQCLRIPAYFKLDNGSVVNGQEGVLVVLKFLATPLRLIEVEQYFGWEHTRLSRIKNWMLSFVYRKHKHRVKNYLHWHVRYI